MECMRFERITRGRMSYSEYENIADILLPDGQAVTFIGPHDTVIREYNYGSTAAISHRHKPYSACHLRNNSVYS